MRAYDLFDSRSFDTKMEMALAVLARKRPKPTQEEQGEAFQPIVDFILERAGKQPVIAAIVPTQPAEAPLRPDEKIVAQTADEIARANAGPITDMLEKIHAQGQATKERTFTVSFDRSEGHHVQELAGYIQSAGLPYAVVSIGLGAMQFIFEQHNAGERAMGWNVVLNKL